MYTGLKHLHSFLPYLLLLVLIAAIVKALMGWLSNKPFTKADNILGSVTMGLAHLQLLVGIVLYFVSPIITAAMESGEMMKNADNRFIGVEHPVTMILAIILISVGRIVSKRASTDQMKHRRAAVYFAIGFALIISRIPAYWWPFM